MSEQSAPAQSAFTNEQINAPFPQPIFTTARLIIRSYHPKDATSMALSANNPNIAKYMTNSFPSPYDLSAANGWIGMNIGQTHPAHFAIFDKSAPDAVIGGLGLNKLSTDVHAHTAEIGYWLAENYWGKGYMTEAVEGFTQWCFESFEGPDGQRMRKLYGGVYSWNLGSMRCFLKNGYVPEGVMKGQVEKNGETLDLHWFGLTKGDWEARK
jgi:ribosomal-protein-alanine N-acetyltransferase